MIGRINRTLCVAAGMLAVLAVCLGWVSAQWYASQPKPFDPMAFNGTVLATPRPIAPFVLTGVDGKPFDSAALQGQWTMMFFGFTQCGHVCPTTMAQLSKMYRLLEADAVSPLPKVMMVSIDPKRDSNEKLQQYVKAFHPDFYGARGDEAELLPLTQSLGVAYETVIGEQGRQDIQHTGAIMLFNPQGELAAFFTSPHQADALAQDLKVLLTSRY